MSRRHQIPETSSLNSLLSDIHQKERSAVGRKRASRISQRQSLNESINNAASRANQLSNSIASWADSTALKSPIVQRKRGLNLKSSLPPMPPKDVPQKYTGDDSRLHDISSLRNTRNSSPNTPNAHHRSSSLQMPSSTRNGILKTQGNSRAKSLNRDGVKVLVDRTKPLPPTSPAPRSPVRESANQIQHNQSPQSARIPYSKSHPTTLNQINLDSSKDDRRSRSKVRKSSRDARHSTKRATSHSAVHTTKAQDRRSKHQKQSTESVYSVEIPSTSLRNSISRPVSPVRSISKKRNIKKDEYLRSMETLDPYTLSGQLETIGDVAVAPSAEPSTRKKLKNKISPRKRLASSSYSDHKLKSDIAADIEQQAVDCVVDSHYPLIAEQMFSKQGKKVLDYIDQILSIRIHCADSFRPNIKVLHPVVKVHILDLQTGQYLCKSDSGRAVTTNLEGANIGYILPVMTKPYSFPKNLSLAPKWEEELVFNEEYLHIVKKDIVVFFEVLDFASNRREFQNSGKTDAGWYHVCWAFLKLVSKSQLVNTEEQVRLQLYQYPKNILAYSNDGYKDERQKAPLAYKCWKVERKAYPSTLRVTVKAIAAMRNRDVTIRPILPTDTEIGKYSFEQLMDEYHARNELIEPMMKTLLTLSSKPQWRRLPGQRCKLPNKLMYRIEPGTKGAQCIAFSNNGIYLAVGCITAPTPSSGKNIGYDPHDASYPIKIYNVVTGNRVASLEGHQDLVYELNWSQDDENLVSASSDGSVRVWMFLGDGSVRASSSFQHSSYVYTASFHPQKTSPRMLATGAFDGCIRLWEYDPNKRPQKGTLHETPIAKLEGHSSAVNSICFDNMGSKLYSGDADGIIKVWSISTPANISVDASTAFFDDYRCLKTISTLKGLGISSIKMHPANRKILVLLQNCTIQSLDIRIYRFLTQYEHHDSSKYATFDTLSNLKKNGNSLYRQLDDHPSSLEQSNTPVASSDSPLTRAAFSPCGYQLWSSDDKGRVLVWKSDTGDLSTIYDTQNTNTSDFRVAVGMTERISDIAYHPHDHIVAFCAFGDNQPVILLTWDKDIKQKEILSGREILNESDIPAVDVYKGVSDRPSLVMQAKLSIRRREITSIADLLATSMRDSTLGRQCDSIDLSESEGINQPVHNEDYCSSINRRHHEDEDAKQDSAKIKPKSSIKKKRPRIPRESKASNNEAECISGFAGSGRDADIQ